MKKKILVADDDKTLRISAKTFLTGKGYDVTVAEDGVEAMEKVKEVTPEVVITDVMMPRKNGFEVCEDIKSEEKTEDTIVFIVSGNVPEIEKGFDYGADDCIVKPLDWDELSEKIEQHILEQEE
ncbi:MAG: response regulator [Elusimicrobiota bacterium]